MPGGWQQVQVQLSAAPGLLVSAQSGFFRRQEVLLTFLQEPGGQEPRGTRASSASAFPWVRASASPCPRGCEPLPGKSADKACGEAPSILPSCPVVHLIRDDGHCVWGGGSGLGAAPAVGVVVAPGLSQQGASRCPGRVRALRKVVCSAGWFRKTATSPHPPQPGFPGRVRFSRKENQKPVLSGLWAAGLGNMEI